LNYWKDRFDIQEEFGSLKSCGPFSIRDVEANFLIGIFYIHMIFSIVVDQSDPAWKKNQAKNSKIVKDMVEKFAQNFQKNLEVLMMHDKIAQGSKSRLVIKYKRIKLNWLLIRKFLQNQDRCKIVYLKLEKITRIDFFDDVFGYSISSLNQGIFGHFELDFQNGDRVTQ
jgi:hypothetical protein